MARSAAHSIAKDDHGTPPPFRKLGRDTLGVIDLDPASSPKWNAAIGAKRIITREQDARVTPWFDGAPAPHRLQTEPRRAPEGHRATVQLNPPGNKDGSLVADLYCALTRYFELGWVTHAMYIGFNVEQASRLQRVGAPFGPLAFPTLVPPYRENYEDEPGRLQEDAPHASFVTLFSRDPIVVGRFIAFASAIGDVVRRIV